MRLKANRKTLLIMNIVLSLLCILLVGFCVMNAYQNEQKAGRNIAIQSIYLNVENPTTITKSVPTVIYLGEANSESTAKKNASAKEEETGEDTENAEQDSEVLKEGGRENAKTTAFPLTQEVQLALASEAGRSGHFSISPDGSFKGDYKSSTVVDGEDYIVSSKFNGKFQNIRPISDYAYAATLSELVYTNKQDGYWVENGEKCIFGDAAGLKSGAEFILYLPGAKQSEMPEACRALYAGFNPDATLDTYALFCEATALGYFGKK